MSFYIHTLVVGHMEIAFLNVYSVCLTFSQSVNLTIEVYKYLLDKHILATLNIIKLVLSLLDDILFEDQKTYYKKFLEYL